MALDTQSKAIESLKEAARNFAALADAVGEQVRPAVKLAVDAADQISSAIGSDQVSSAAPIVVGPNPARESLDEAAREFGVLIDSVGDQMRPAVKFAVDTVDSLTYVMESAREASDIFWKSLGIRRASAA